jgi:hypothetical protein
MTPKHVAAMQDCICIYQDAFVGVMSENLDSKINGINNVRNFKTYFGSVPVLRLQLSSLRPSDGIL